MSFESKVVVFHLICNLNVELVAVGYYWLLKIGVWASVRDKKCTAESSEQSMDWVSDIQLIDEHRSWNQPWRWICSRTLVNNSRRVKADMPSVSLIKNKTTTTKPWSCDSKPHMSLLISKLPTKYSICLWFQQISKH